MEKTLAEKIPEHIKERSRLREVAANFKALIEMKQSEYAAKKIDYKMKDLLVGTEYENSVTLRDQYVEYISPLSTIIYQWAYTERCGDVPAALSETHGFKVHG